MLCDEVSANTDVAGWYYTVVSGQSSSFGAGLRLVVDMLVVELQFRDIYLYTTHTTEQAMEAAFVKFLYIKQTPFFCF